MMVRKRRSSKALKTWQKSAQFSAIAREAIQRWNALRPTLPKCLAARRSDGQPCQHLALANGRCRYHGGRVPKGDDYHRPVWPDGKAKDATAKTYAKIRQLDRRQKKRKARLCAMTPEQRAAHDEWHRLRPAGSAKARRAASTRRQHDRTAAQLFAQSERETPPESEENRALLAERARLEQELADLEASITAREAGADMGIFG